MADVSIEFWDVAQTNLEDVFMKLTHGAPGDRALAHGAAEELRESAVRVLNFVDANDAEERILGSVSIEPDSTLAFVRALIQQTLNKLEHW